MPGMGEAVAAPQTQGSPVSKRKCRKTVDARGGVHHREGRIDGVVIHEHDAGSRERKIVGGDLWREVVVAQKAVACLIKDRDALLALFDFPAEHWDHLRTSNPIESVFATTDRPAIRSIAAVRCHGAASRI